MDPRIVCQFSCGAASAVATKLALAQYGDRCEIINAYLRNEHPDNRRFLADCERCFAFDADEFSKKALRYWKRATPNA